MASKTTAAIHIILRKNDRIDVTLTAGTACEKVQCASWDHVMTLVQQVKPRGLKQLETLQQAVAVHRASQARWPWAQPLVNFLCGGAK